MPGTNATSDQLGAKTEIKLKSGNGAILWPCAITTTLKPGLMGP